MKGPDFIALHKLFDDVRVPQSEVDGKFAAVRTADENRSTDLSLTQKRGQIFDLGVPGGRGRSASVPPPVVPNGMELLTEIRPHVVPHRRVGNSIVDENYRLRTCSTFLEVELRSFDLDERSGPGSLGGACGLGDGLTTRPEHEHERAKQRRGQPTRSNHGHTAHRILPIARARIAMRVGTPNRTSSSIRAWAPSAISLVNSSPRMIGPGCITMASFFAIFNRAGVI